MCGPSTFSPLFIGVIGATTRKYFKNRFSKSFSPLFIGVIGATEKILATNQPIPSFSPLFIGVIGATHTLPYAQPALGFLSVPYSSG